jgi:hypothetical protein
MEWGVGPFRPSNEAERALPYNAVEYDSLDVAGRQLRLLTLSIGDRYSTFANFDATATLPHTRFTAYAVGRAARDEQRRVLRTVRFAAPR